MKINLLDISELIGKVTLVIAPPASGKTDVCRKIVKVLRNEHNFDTGLIIGKNPGDYDLSTSNTTFSTELNTDIINSFCQKQKHRFEQTKNKAFLILDNMLGKNVWDNHSILKICIDHGISAGVTLVITMEQPISFPSGLKNKIQHIMISGNFNEKDQNQIYKSFDFSKEMINLYHQNAYRYYYFVFTPSHICYWFTSRSGYFHSARGYLFGMK